MSIPKPIRILTLTMAIVTCAAPCFGGPRILNSHGEQIDSVFAGVTVRQPPMPVQEGTKDAQRIFIPTDTLPLASNHARLKLVACDLGSCCVGHYIDVYPVSGGCYMNACQLNNIHESTIMAEYRDGAWPFQYSQYCCDTAFHCINNGGECL